MNSNSNPSPEGSALCRQLTPSGVSVLMPIREGQTHLGAKGMGHCYTVSAEYETEGSQETRCVPERVQEHYLDLLSCYIKRNTCGIRSSHSDIKDTTKILAFSRQAALPRIISMSQFSLSACITFENQRNNPPGELEIGFFLLRAVGRKWVQPKSQACYNCPWVPTVL